MPEALEGEAIPERLDIEVVRSCQQRTEVRTDSQDSPVGTLVGEFSVFGDWYEINSMWEGHFLERTAAGAFKRTINNRSGQSPVRVILEHGFDPTVADKPLGVPKVLEERSTGVYGETPLFDTSYNRDLAPALQGGAYGQSFRFQVMRDEFVEPDAEGWADTGNPAWADLPQRTITEVRLIEFGPTIWPASPSTNGTTGLRSDTDRFYEQLARRDQSAFEAAVRSVRSHRAPVAAKAAETTEDPQTGHSNDPVSAPVERSHSEDPPQVKHSEDTHTRTTSQKEKPMSEILTIEERAARKSEIDARLTEINIENRGGALSAEVQDEWDSLAEERAVHVQAIKAQEERDEFLRSIAANEASHESHEDVQSRAKRYAPQVSTRPTGEDIYDLNAIRTKSNGMESLNRNLRDHALRAIESSKFPGEDRSKAQEKVADLLDKVEQPEKLAERILATGSPAYDRAFGKAVTKQGLTSEEQRALSLGSDADGGYAVPFQLDPTVILVSDGVVNPLRSIARVVQITGKSWEGLTSEGMTVTRKGEVAEATDDSPQFDQPVVNTSRADGFAQFSVALEYSWGQLRAELTSMLADAKNVEEANSFVNGAGTTISGNGGGTLPQGVLVGATNATTTASATALTRSDLYKVHNGLPQRFRANAQWLAEQSFYDICRGLDEIGDVWTPLAAGGYPPLLGKKVNEASEMPAASLTANSKLALYGDFARAFIIVDRIGMSVELVPQVFGPNGRPTGQRGIFAYWFNGSKVIVPQALQLLKAAAV